MYYMILYDIICYMYPNIGSNCLRGCIHAWLFCTPLLHTITRSHQQETPTHPNTIPLYLSRERAMNETCRWRQKSRNSRDLRRLAKSPRHAAIGISAQLHVYRHYVYKIGKHCLNYIHFCIYIYIYICR